MTWNDFFFWFLVKEKGNLYLPVENICGENSRIFMVVLTGNQEVNS